MIKYAPLESKAERYFFLFYRLRVKFGHLGL
jgi:hypothetical protein